MGRNRFVPYINQRDVLNQIFCFQNVPRQAGPVEEAVEPVEGGHTPGIPETPEEDRAAIPRAPPTQRHLARGGGEHRVSAMD